MATFTLYLVIVGGLQLLATAGAFAATWRAASAARISADTASALLSMTHRPLLIVRHVVVKGIDKDGELVGTGFTDGYVQVANIGVLPATLLYLHAEWWFGETLPIENPALIAVEDARPPIPMSPGSVRKVPIPNREISVPEFAAINHAVQGTTPSFGEEVGTIHLIGYARYSDEIGPRRTFFCFRYDTTLRRFEPVDHPSYNYED